MFDRTFSLEAILHSSSQEDQRQRIREGAQHFKKTTKMSCTYIGSRN